MTDYKTIGDLQVATELSDLVESRIAPGTGIGVAQFWQSLSEVFAQLTPVNRALLEKRQQLQQQIDRWHLDRKGQPHDAAAYKEYLYEIGYLEPEVGDFEITTTGVDDEISVQAGPQLVVPVKNARFALNAANARWGSLYDALYGTDAISNEGGAEAGREYNPARGAKVIAFAKQYLDETVPLVGNSHADVVKYWIDQGVLKAELKSGAQVGLQDVIAFVGYTGDEQGPERVLLKQNGLHLELVINRDSLIGAGDSAGMEDIIVEAALTTIMDCEDSIAAVDAEDKAEVYANWLGLMRGDLTETFEKGGKEMTRSLQPDREYTGTNGELVRLHGRSLMFVRNVGHLMTNNAVLNAQGEEIPEGILDAMMTAFIALHDLKQLGQLRNSRTGSVYIVKPKMHGSEEVAFTVRLFEMVENALGMAPNTLKIGIMDEERRTSLNLKNCIHAAKERAVFINTGFLDRTGDEMHTSMHAGVFIPKAQMKQTKWIAAYENNNVDVGLACGLPGKAQIGKGMWAMPDEMAAMLEQKIAHPKSGATTAWVPSPNGATLHSIHYHQVDVFALQQELRQRTPASIDDILQIPLMTDPEQLTAEQIRNELENNAQGILGYVVRWVEQGVGCSKVPDIHNVGLMEDRATLRISSQHMANWLLHGVVSQDQVEQVMKKMAAVVDQQNEGEAGYRAMSSNFDRSVAFKAAMDLVLKGVEQPSGYTEPLLHAYRAEAKNQ
ncbi:malate synthase G [Reinekea marinisedimentorum]|uniref:Malate synthase G n=1 Tax=Reinekea marinisedimentorum TaxID=230495 RepID=A0A4R3IDB7_9GAMM|nr:malate synthase G [Reinekea marinisedimentorum]TCS42655.1 malate synthase [Reinekea marinisedimentorum]